MESLHRPAMFQNLRLMQEARQTSRAGFLNEQQPHIYKLEKFLRKLRVWIGAAVGQSGESMGTCHPTESAKTPYNAMGYSLGRKRLRNIDLYRIIVYNCTLNELTNGWDFACLAVEMRAFLTILHWFLLRFNGIRPCMVDLVSQKSTWTCDWLRSGLIIHIDLVWVQKRIMVIGAVNLVTRTREDYAESR